jgi:hypothetical protein
MLRKSQTLVESNGVKSTPSTGFKLAVPDTEHFVFSNIIKQKD